MNEPRVYKNSPFLFTLMLFIFGILFIGLVVAMGPETWYIMVPFALVFGVIFLTAIFSMTSKTIISEDEISTQNLLGTKTLRWSEIKEISGSGNGIKLQDMDRYLTVAPSSGLSGYPEVIEWIGVKRPDLFNPLEYTEMSRSLVARVINPTSGFVMIGLGLFLYIQKQATDAFFITIMLAVVGLGFIVSTFATVQSLVIQGNSLMIGYLLNRKTLLADEITSIDFGFTQSRNGKNYYVALNLVNRKTIRLSGMKPNLPVVYLVLKNWHKKNVKPNELRS